MISSVLWIPKGVFRPLPVSAESSSNEETETIHTSAASVDSGIDSGNEIDDEDMDVDASKNVDDEVVNALAVAQALGKASKNSKSAAKFEDIADGLRELDMDNYDEEDDGVDLFSSGGGELYYANNKMDPYLKDKDGNDSEEIEDMTIKQSDGVIICARNDDNVNQLEVLIFEEADDGDPNMYNRHYILLPAFPLCTAWIDCPIKGGEKGNFIAIGSMEPSIEIWDLDIIDDVRPCVVLGGIIEKKRKGKKKSIKYKENSHTDSVLGLAWNKEYRNILASASADTEVKIWDVATGECTITMKHHTNKVQAVAWNHHSPQVLLSGSFDRSVVLKDGRIPSHPGYKWQVTADVESLAWDPHTEHSFMVSLEDGTVQGFDIRAAVSDKEHDSKPSFTLQAHDKAVSSVSYNSSAPNFLATGSMDKTVKLWDLSNNQPSCVASRKFNAGAVFSISFSQDWPFLLAMGGSKGTLEVWDTLTEAGVSQKFGNTSKMSNRP